MKWENTLAWTGGQSEFRRYVSVGKEQTQARTCGRHSLAERPSVTYTRQQHAHQLPAAVPNPIFQVINLTGHCKTLYNSALLDIQPASHLCKA